MAWNDSLEQQLDALIEDFGSYLSQNTTLAINDRTRVQEVCRDFCNFLGKDIDHATSQDFQMYIQLHAMSREAESDYNGIMNLIQLFTNARQRAESPALTLSNLVEVSESNPPESSVDPHDLSSLYSTPFNPNAGNANNDLYATPVPTRGSMVPSTQNALNLNPTEYSDLSPANFPSKYNSASNPKVSGMFQMSNGDSRIPGNRFGLSGKLSDPQAKTPSKGTASIGNSLRNFDFSIAQDADELGSSQLPPPGSKSMSVAETLGHQSSVGPAISPTPTASGEISSLRVVSGINYDFSPEGKRQILAIETNSSQKDAKQAVDPIDKRLINGFRPYVFDKYLIDIPLPSADKFILPGSMMFLRIMALSPAIVLFICSLPGFIFFPIAGVVLLVLSLLLAAIILPDILPKPHMTPHVTMSSFVKCYNGRCFTGAASLVARPVSGDKVPEIAALWKSAGFSLGQFLPRRIKSLPDPRFVTASGSEAQNAMLMLFEMNGGYYLVPIVRLKTGWFVTDASMTYHKLDTK